MKYNRMTNPGLFPLKLSELVGHIQEVIDDSFEGETFWITAEITDVRKQESARRCYLKFIEKQGKEITAEIRGVFWAGHFEQIVNFEKATGQKFDNGIEITVLVKVRFHPRYGLNLDALQIDLSFALGKLELERQQCLERLVKENPEVIRLVDGQYQTLNNQLIAPVVIQRIALVTAPNSDGQRDFNQELKNNKHGYAFSVKEFLTQIQGENAGELILEKLKRIFAEKEKYDVVAIVRGGGSQIDFKPFDDYELSKFVATFPIPILTGIGHDRNTSIVDLMAVQHKTPTKVAGHIVEHNFDFENRIIDMKDRFFEAVERIFENGKNDLEKMKRIVRSSSPSTILKRGFAIIMSENKIVTDPKKIKEKMELQTILKNQIIQSIVTQKKVYEFKSL